MRMASESVISLDRGGCRHVNLRTQIRAPWRSALDGRALVAGCWEGGVRLRMVGGLPTVAAIETICRAANRDLTARERSVHFPPTAHPYRLYP